MIDMNPSRALLMSRAIRANTPRASGMAVRPSGAPSTVAGPIVSPGLQVFWGALATASLAVSAYHGVKRHHGSAGWGVAWGSLGALFPVLTPAVAVAQGFAKPLPR